MDNYQNILFPYAYNILGSAEDAKDAIQDVLLKYTLKREKPHHEKNYLIKSVINKSINKKRDRKLHESGEELPQPMLTSGSEVSAEMKDLVSYSLMILLERLNPKERAVYILKEAFAYTHQEIAEVLSVSVENARKLQSRAVAKLKSTGGKKKKADFTKIKLFAEAIHSRDLSQLHQLFHEEIVFRADGGKQIQVVSKYQKGVGEVSDLVIYVHHRFQSSYQVRYSTVNHQPAILYYDGNTLKVCQVFEFDEEHQFITSISTVLDPEKLAFIT